MPLSPDRSAGETGIPRLDVVALIAASTGIGAVEVVLRSLPEGLSTAVLVALEAGDETEDALDALRRQGVLPVAWAVEEEPLRAGEIRVCPPGQGLEVFPDLTCAFSSLALPLDGLVESLAESLGPRAVAVFLGGAGEDGIAGAFALRQAGGTVVAQSEDTAEHPVLPVAVASRGAAQLVLPLHEIGPLLTALANGEAIPPLSEEARAVEALFRGEGEMSELMRAEDWSRTPLGPVGGWSAALRASIGLALESPMPTIVLWGRDLVQLYNDPYRELMADKHPAGLGQSTRDCWPEVWHINEPIYERVFRGESVGVEDALYPLMRHGALHDVWLNVYSVPIRDEAGEVAGVMVSVIETTEKVVAARRFATLQALSTAHASTEAGVCERAATALTSNPSDLPFALIYRLDDRATLSGVVGLSADSAAAPPTMELGGGHPAWPLAKVAREATPTLLTDLDARFRGLGLPPSALLLPLPHEGGKPPLGILVVGINPRQPLDRGYRGFLDLIATRLGVSLAAARSQAEEGERRERLAELDWAKNEFFANVSHEFRTPLTLMLAPLGELLYHREQLPGLLADEVEVAARSARRLLTLVNTLLDFSQIEAGRMRLRLEEADLAATTRDVAALFIPAAERAGIRLRIDCPPLAERAWVDVDMWEKIVSNLLSNALKFTFEGEIEVRLRELAGHVELVVRDTGVGIPKGEIPNLFKRFHRVRGARARTQEGSGVGLALVDELVRLHGGRVRVRSVEGEGSAFTVWIPRGTETLEDALATRLTPARHRPAATLAAEAARWGPTPDPFAAPSIEELSEMLGEPLQVRGRGARVLVVDDNADMRDHLSRLLAPHWDVETAVDGADALRKARQSPPELILADMAMPNVSGSELVRQVREDGSLKGVPVVLLTARSGEESAVEGLLAGADDYLVKPFSSRELIARVGAQIELAKVRGRAQELNGFLLRFSDAVRGSTDPHFVIETICRMVAVHLGADRSHWAEVDWERREFVAEGAYADPESPAIVSRSPLDGWNLHTQGYLQGRPAVVPDTQKDSGIPDASREILAQSGIYAVIGVPVMAEGRLAGVFTVSHRSPRPWTADNISFLEAVADRAKAEVVRARAEAALRESNARFGSIVNLVPDLLWSSHPDGFTDWYNQRWSEYTGQTFEGAIGWGWIDSIHPEDREASARRYRGGVESGRTIVQEHRIRRRDGEYRWFLVRTEPVRDEAGILKMFGSATDIHAQRTMIATVRESEARKAFLLKLSDALRPLADGAEMERTATRMLGEELGANRAFYATVDEDGESWSVQHDYADGVSSIVGRYPMSGFQRERMEGWQAGRRSSVADSENDPTLSAADRAAYAAFGARAAIGVPLVKGGRFAALLTINQTTPRVWTEAELALTQEVAERTWAAIERARAETTLRENEARLGAIAHILPGGAVFVVDRDLRYTMAAGEALAASGFGPEDLVGKTVGEAMPPELAAPYEANYRTALAGGTFMVEHEAHGRSYVSRGLPLPSPDGTIDAALVVSYDVSERKGAEAALRESHALFDAALSSLPHHVHVMDAAGRFLYVNEALLAYWGISRDEALGRTPLELGHPPELAAQIASGIAQALATGGRVSGTFYSPSPSVPEVAYEYVYTPFHGVSGPPDRVVGWSREIGPVARDR